MPILGTNNCYIIGFPIQDNIPIWTPPYPSGHPHTHNQALLTSSYFTPATLSIRHFLYMAALGSPSIGQLPGSLSAGQLLDTPSTWPLSVPSNYPTRELSSTLTICQAVIYLRVSRHSPSGQLPGTRHQGSFQALAIRAASRHSPSGQLPGTRHQGSFQALAIRAASRHSPSGQLPGTRHQGSFQALAIRAGSRHSPSGQLPGTCHQGSFQALAIRAASRHSFYRSLSKRQLQNTKMWAGF